ncbi:MAG: helix-turn-helix domain-containing protein [Phreatobacter sp.]
MNNPHKNARTTPRGRAEMIRRIVEDGLPFAEVAAGFGISEQTARKWLSRWRTDGEAGLENRSSRPRAAGASPGSEDDRVRISRDGPPGATPDGMPSARSCDAVTVMPVPIPARAPLHSRVAQHGAQAASSMADRLSHSSPGR